MSLLAPAAAIGQAHRVAAHPRRRTGSKTAAAREMAAAAAAAEAEADDSSELSDLDSPGDGSEVEDNFEDVWAVAVTSPSAARSRYSKPEDEGVVQYRRYCADLGCVPISYYEMHYADGPVVMNDHGIGGTGGVALAKSLAINCLKQPRFTEAVWVLGQSFLLLLRQSPRLLLVQFSSTPSRVSTIRPVLSANALPIGSPMHCA